MKGNRSTCRHELLVRTHCSEALRKCGNLQDARATGWLEAREFGSSCRETSNVRRQLPPSEMRRARSGSRSMFGGPPSNSALMDTNDKSECLS